MKKFTIISLVFAAACSLLSAEDIRYVLTGHVASVTQTDLDPQYLWDESVFSGSPVILTVDIGSDITADLPSEHFSGYSPVSFRLSAGNYYFSSSAAFVGLNNDLLFAEGTADGFSFTMVSIEQYFGNTFQISGFLVGSDLGLFSSSSPTTLNERSYLFDLSSTLAVASPNAEFRFSIDNVSAAVIPEPALYSVSISIVILMYLIGRRRLTRRYSE